MDMSFSEIVVDDTRLMHVVDSLTPYTNYTIKMAAATSVGRGEFGPEMTVETYESSKHNTVCTCIRISMYSYNTFQMFQLHACACSCMCL